jgi:rRNA maturation endonuclease Nob1
MIKMMCLGCKKYFVFLEPPDRCPECGGVLGEKKDVAMIKIIKIWVKP